MELNKKTAEFPVSLFCSLMLLSVLPFFYTIVRTHLIASGPSADGLGIAGHMEWFDLLNETIQAFLIVPLFALLNQCMQDQERLRERIFQSFLIVNVVYLAFSVVIFVRCSDLVEAMLPERMDEVTRYLQLETIGFMIANAVSFVNVLFVVLGRSSLIYAMALLRTVLTVIGDLFLIPRFGVNGIACSNIIVNAAGVILCLWVVYREKLMAVSFRFAPSFVKDYLQIGLFSGSQILLDNLIYSAVVCKMVNAVAEQGNYWTANNIIWGFLLIPILALAEIVKKDCREELTAAKWKAYHAVILVTFLVWLCLIPVLDPFLKYIMGIENSGTIKYILVTLIPFYLVYNYTVLFDNLMIGHGKTGYCFFTSVIVNLIYYPIVYGCVQKGIFIPNLTFICLMFGFGMIVHLGCSIFCFLLYRRYGKTRISGRLSVRKGK